jgi:hypothetical protein
LFDSLKKGIFLVAQMFLCVGFLGVGMLKIVGYPTIAASFQKWNFPTIFMYVIGFIEVVLSISLLYKPSRFYSQILAAVILIGLLLLLTFITDEK